MDPQVSSSQICKGMLTYLEEQEGERMTKEKTETGYQGDIEPSSEDDETYVGPDEQTEENCCRNCRFFRPATGLSPSSCHCHPPSPTWPAVSYTDWCGKHHLTWDVEIERMKNLAETEANPK